MSIRKKTYIANFIMLTLPIILIIAFLTTFVNISNQSSLVIWLFWFSVIIVVIVNIFVTLYITRSITEPIKKLIYATREIEKGNLDYVINYTINDEFFDVIKEFDQMRLELKKSIEEIQINNKEKKQLTESIVHDLKTPITAILGYSQALIDDVPKTEEKKRYYIQIINEKTKHIDHLVDSLFLLSNIENKILPYNLKYVNIGEIKKYIEEYQFYLSEKEIKSSLTCNCKNDSYIFIDCMQMKRVLQNIIENSIKYSSERPLVIDFLLRENKKNFILKIIDNGIGINKSQEEKVFEKFFRSDEARTSKDGSGLGLTTCKYIVEGQKGKIWIRNNKDFGISVYISFAMEDNFEKNIDY